MRRNPARDAERNNQRYCQQYIKYVFADPDAAEVSELVVDPEHYVKILVYML